MPKVYIPFMMRIGDNYFPGKSTVDVPEDMLPRVLSRGAKLVDDKQAETKPVKKLDPPASLPATPPAPNNPPADTSTPPATTPAKKNKKGSKTTTTPPVPTPPVPTPAPNDPPATDSPSDPPAEDDLPPSELQQ